MSTRCTIHFEYNGRTEAIIYRHCDGYPDGEHSVPADLKRFFKDVKEQTNDTRFDVPSYLAAKYIVWQANRNAKRWNGEEYEQTNMLDFLGVAVLMEDPGDIEWRYHIHCGRASDENGYPRVTWEDVPFDVGD